MPKTCVGRGEPSPWHSDSDSPLDVSNETQSPNPPPLRVVGVFGDSVVLYDHERSQLLVNGEVAIKLPPNALFASNRDNKTRFVLLWTRSGTKTPPKLVRLVNLDSRSVTCIPVAGITDIRDGVVDTRGEHIVLFDAERVHLWRWTASDGTDDQLTHSRGHWQLQGLSGRSIGSRSSQPAGLGLGSASTPLTISSPVCASGVFSRSSLLGNCFTFVRASWKSGGSAVELKTQVFDVDAEWTVTSISTTTIQVDHTSGGSLPAPSTQSPLTMHLRVDTKRLMCVVAIENTLVGIKLNCDAGRREAPTLRAPDRPLFCVPLEQKIVDLVWLDEGQDTLAVLLARGAACEEAQLWLRWASCAVVSVKYTHCSFCDAQVRWCLHRGLRSELLNCTRSRRRTPRQGA